MVDGPHHTGLYETEFRVTDDDVRAFLVGLGEPDVDNHVAFRMFDRRLQFATPDYHGGGEGRPRSMLLAFNGLHLPSYGLGLAVEAVIAVALPPTHPAFSAAPGAPLRRYLAAEHPSVVYL